MKKILTWTLMLSMVLFLNFCKGDDGSGIAGSGNDGNGNGNVQSDLDNDLAGLAQVDPVTLGAKVYGFEVGNLIELTPSEFSKGFTFSIGTDTIEYRQPVISDQAALDAANAKYTDGWFGFYSSQGKKVDTFTPVKFFQDENGGDVYNIKFNGTFTKSEYDKETITVIFFYNDNGTPSFTKFPTFVAQ